MWGWNVVLMDGDGHPIRNEEGKIINYDRPIHINSIIVGTPAVEKKMDVHWDRGEFPLE